MRILSYGLLTIVLVTPICSYPLSFEQRSGNLFRARLPGAAATLRPDRVSLGPVTLRFPGSSPKARLEGVGPSSPSTYLLSGSSRTFPQYPKLAIRGLYPGIDAIFYGVGDGLEYDLSLAPGVSPGRVRLAFDGCRSLRIDDYGNLMMETAGGVLQQKLPRVFQSHGRQVSARYVLLAGHEVGIRLGPYDTRSALTIDPELVYAKYFGGSGSDRATAIATDAQGNISLAGVSNSIDFPGTGGFPSNPDPPLFALTNSGQTVTPVFVGRDANVLAVGGTSDGKILYAVTPAGVYLSSDSGANWVRNAPLPMAATPGNISVDAISPSSLLIPTNRGLYFSSDTGRSWVLHDMGLPAGQNGTVSASQAIISPLDHLICYAVAAGSPNSLFKSTDACNTWRPLNDSYPGEQSASPYVYSSTVMALAPNGSDLYVVDGNAILLKSTDGGASWQGLAQGLFGSMSLIVDPSNPSNIYVLNNYGVQMSKDGGATFSTIVPRRIPGGSSQPVLLQSIAWDAASGTLYVSIQDSVYFTTDSGATLHIVPQISTGTLHSLVDLGGRVYAAIDAPPRPFVMKLDPTGSQILYSTFFGGSWADSIAALKVDAQGNAYVAGTTLSAGFPATAQLSPASPGAQYSAFITKLSGDGTRMIYSSLLGVPNGVSLQGLAIDSSGSAYITGQTSSPDFPTTTNSVQPSVPAAACPRPQTNFFVNPNTHTYAFVSKLRPDGNALVYSTFLTGSCGSAGQGLTVDQAGEAIVTGYTTSPDFPATPGTYQPAFPGDANSTNPLTVGFIARLSAAGDKVLAGSYLGGGYSTFARAVTLDPVGNVLVTGNTSGIAPGATPGAFQGQVASGCAPTFNIGPGPPPTPPGDAFLLKLDSALVAARYLTYLGGACDDSGNALAIDASGNTWLLGSTASPDFPLKAPFQQGLNNIFISELDPNGSQLLFSSYAFSGNTNAGALALDPAGAVLLAGADTSPTISKLPQAFGVGTSVVLDKIDPGANPPVEIDSIAAVTGYPSTVVNPFPAGFAPGQLIQITGHNLGPAAQVNAQLDASGRLQYLVANTMVRFDGLPAPLVSVQDGMIECFAPFEISRTARVTVTNNGQASNAVRIGVTASNPQILSIMNQDGTPNSAKQPAQVGSVIEMYVSGLGLTTPLSLDGLVTSAPLPVPVVPVTVYLPGVIVPAEFVGAAPGLVAGITQINVQLPPGNYPANGAASVSVNSAFAPLYVTQ